MIVKLDDSEVVVRMLLRTKQEMKPANPKFRECPDENDYIRQRELRKTGEPESGLSLIRRTIKQTPDEIYKCIAASSAKGIADCQVKKLRQAGFEVIKDNPLEEHHASLRCGDCNMADITNGAAYCDVKTPETDCQLYRHPDALLGLFTLREEPEIRKVPASVPDTSA